MSTITTRSRAQRLHDGVHLWSYVVLLPLQELHIEHAPWAERLTLPPSMTRFACGSQTTVNAAQLHPMLRVGCCCCIMYEQVQPRRLTLTRSRWWLTSSSCGNHDA